jgi:ERCC4-type nuclease
MGFEGIGRVQAERIVEKFGGVPLSWTCTISELMEVDGIGAGRAMSMIEALDVPDLIPEQE